jgi:hypothetical protein
MYRNGNGVPQDKITAHMWYNISASNGFLGAVDPRDKVAKTLTVEQLVKANEQEKRCIGDSNFTHNGKVIAYRNCDTKAKSWWEILSEVEPEFDKFLPIFGLLIVLFLLVMIVVIVVLIKNRDSISWRMGSSPGDEPTWNWEETIPFNKSRKETKFPERDIDAVTPTPSAKDRAGPFRNSVVQRAETSNPKSRVGRIILYSFVAIVCVVTTILSALFIVGMSI